MMSNKTKTRPESEFPFFYTEECGAAVMMNRPTGKKICVEKDVWRDVVYSVKTGWQPWERQSGNRDN
jgi:hypothetical protein